MTNEELFAFLSRAEEMNFENWKTYRVLYNAELGKLQDRIKTLEAALRFYAENCSGDMKVYKSIIGPSGDYGDVAKAALGEKKE
jgi:hypothetical protein